ncbi:MAG: ABC transporter ATP-binding protein [Alphaproteobacteria bacterium]|nr:ABC transporter ATP-binding protein [Alphaproteobacteria bacterium]
MALEPSLAAINDPKPRKYLSFFTVLRFAAGYWRRQPKKLAVILLMLAASASLETYLPSALASFLGAIRQHDGAAVVYARLILFLGLYATQAGIFAATFLVYNTFETRIFKALMDDAFTHVHSLSEHFFINTFTGSIISKINRGRQKVENFEDQILLRVFPTTIVLIGSTAFLALRFPGLALVMTVYLGILLAASFLLVMKFAGPAQGAYADAQDSFIAHLADSISGIAATKSYAQEKIEIARFVGITAALRSINLRSYIYSSSAGFIQRLMLAGMLALLLGGGTWYFFHGQANVENMAYLAFAYTIMQSYIRDLGENIKNILTSSYDLHAVIALMREKPEVEKTPALPALAIRKGEIVFDHVSFAYPGKTQPIFKGLCVSIRAGERVALVGHSGSGKTSFVRLLQCLYAAQEGRILVDGQDIAQGSRPSLRSAISLVPQDPILFHRTLRENIAYGKPDASMEEIRDAARQANIGQFILGLPLQYETLVGERGIKLSGGERQRIAIARAILANRPILILDEATSSLDSISERAIQEALRSLAHGRTSIMIAHRLSTILDADRILVFDQGRIVEEGTHDDLILKENGIYAGFFKLQSGGFIKE